MSLDHSGKLFFFGACTAVLLMSSDVLSDRAYGGISIVDVNGSRTIYSRGSQSTGSLSVSEYSVSDSVISCNLQTVGSLDSLIGSYYWQSASLSVSFYVHAPSEMWLQAQLGAVGGNMGSSSIVIRDFGKIYSADGPSDIYTKIYLDKGLYKIDINLDGYARVNMYSSIIVIPTPGCAMVVGCIGWFAGRRR